MTDPDTPLPPAAADGPVRRRRRGIYLLPNLLTTGTLFSGFYSIIAAIDGHYEAAAQAIFIAMVFDGLDGRVARWTKTASGFGKEYDSLSDMVAFGVAPAIVVYQWGVTRIAEYNAVWGRVGWAVTFLYAVAAALRLARFNTRTSIVDKRYFEGLPSPSAAGVVAGFIWCAASFGLAGLPGLLLALPVTAIAGVLMVSQFYYPSFKGARLTGRVPYTYALLIPLAFALIVLHPPLVLLALFFGFAASGPLAATIRRVRGTPIVPVVDAEH